MRKLLLAALLALTLYIPTNVNAQYIQHVLMWGAHASKGDGTFEGRAFMVVRWGGDDFPTKQGCQDTGEAELEKVKGALAAVSGVKAGPTTYEVQVRCIPRLVPGRDA